MLKLKTKVHTFTYNQEDDRFILTTKRGLSLTTYRIIPALSPDWVGIDASGDSYVIVYPNAGRITVVTDSGAEDLTLQQEHKNMLFTHAQQISERYHESMKPRNISAVQIAEMGGWSSENAAYQAVKRAGLPTVYTPSPAERAKGKRALWSDHLIGEWLKAGKPAYETMNYRGKDVPPWGKTGYVVAAQVDTTNKRRRFVPVEAPINEVKIVNV